MSDDASAPMTDYTPMTGAQFARQVGIDPEKWAARFIAAYTEAEGPRDGRRVAMPIAEFCEAEGRTDADRLAFVTAWFRDAMEAAVKHVILQGTQMALDEMRRDD